MTAMSDLDVLQVLPGYKAILKGVIKTQIQLLVEQLSQHTEEESIILTASLHDGTLTHLGSPTGKGFLDGHDEIKTQFLGYCLKTHHRTNRVDRKSPLPNSWSHESPSQTSYRRNRHLQSAAKRPRITQPVTPATPSGDADTLPHHSDNTSSAGRGIGSSKRKRRGVGRKPGPVCREAAEQRLNASDDVDDNSEVKLEADSDDPDNDCIASAEHINLPPSLQLPHTQTSADAYSNVDQNDDDDADNVDEIPYNEDNDDSKAASVSNVKVEPITETELELEMAEAGGTDDQDVESDWGHDTSADQTEFDISAAAGDGSLAESDNKAGYTYAQGSMPVFPNQPHHPRDITIGSSLNYDAALLKINELLYNSQECTSMAPVLSYEESSSNGHPEHLNRKYCCHLCDKSYFRNSCLRRHLVSHTGERFPCRVCSKTFTQANVRNTHEKNAHGRELHLGQAM